MDKIVSEEGLTFDDILLLPGYTDFKRSEVDLATRLHESITLKLPIVSSPMDTVCEDPMAIALAEEGGLGIIHRNLAVDKQADMVSRVKSKKLLVGAAVGAGDDLKERLKAIVNANVDVITIDSGHGNSKFIVDAVTYIKKMYPKMVVMAGNIATYDGALMLINAGADILRVGMGPGSICTTRIITGMGVPQITAIMEAVRAVKGRKVTVVADGGIRQMGDMAKALGVGAHVVMLGSMLSGYDESPGNMLTLDGKKYKQYRGMGSVAAMKKGGAERYGQKKDTEEKKLIAEGVEGLVEYKGSVKDFLYQSAGSLRSSFYYVGAKYLNAFQDKAQFIKISNAGLRESHPHTISIVDAGNNYTVK